jgi:hypothetical protein
MNHFSIGEAYGAGFGLVGRKPLQVLTWGIVVTVLRMLPFVLMLWLVGPQMIKGWADFASVMAARGDPHEAAETLRETMSGFNSFSALSWLTSIVSVGLLNAAVFRAVLRPNDGGFMGLKFGMDEVWQGLIYLCAFILLIIFAVLVVLACVAIGGIIVLAANAAGASGWFNGLAISLVAIAGVVTIIWICLRFSLAGPATFAERNFQLFESWTLTKGHSWSLLGLALLLFVTILAFEMVAATVLMATMIALGANAAFSPESIEAFFAQSPDVWMGQAMPWMIGMGVIGGLISGAVYTILVAPFASAYAQIARASA